MLLHLGGHVNGTVCPAPPIGHRLTNDLILGVENLSGCSELGVMTHRHLETISRIYQAQELTGQADKERNPLPEPRKEEDS